MMLWRDKPLVRVSLSTGSRQVLRQAQEKSFDLESLDLDLETERLETERLETERLTPPDNLGIFDMPGVHQANAAEANSRAAD